MAEENQESQEEGEEGEGQKKGGLKKIILIAGLVLLLLIGAGGGAAVMLGVFDPPPDENEQAEAPVEVQLEPEAVFLEIPDLIVNLNSTGRKATFLKIKIALEVENAEEVEEINQVLPRIIDNFQLYMRELRVTDLQGSAGLYRLREELLRRVNLAVRPSKVKDILFKEMLVQ